jgi:hypothetical protein
MKKYLNTITILILLLVIIIIAGIAIDFEAKVQVEPRTGHAIYITRTDRIRTMDGRDIWLLEYTIDGIFQSPAFNSLEAMIEYREYLGTIGKVYQREEED